MTVSDLLALIWRWRVLLPVGLLATGVALLHVRSAPPVYWSQSELRVMTPDSLAASNTLTASNGGPIAMAGLVVREVDRSDPPAVSDSADLPGLGVREGWQLRLPNSGGQWEPDFDRPVIDLQVVGPTRDEVARTGSALTTEVLRELDALQAADGIPPASRMRINVHAAQPRTMEMGGSRARAELVTVALGGWATVALVLAAGPFSSAAGRWSSGLRTSHRNRSRRRRFGSPAGAA